MESTETTWTRWTGTKVAHAVNGIATAGDVRNGSFPLKCGRWAPDPMDRAGLYLDVVQSGPYCRRCLNAVEQS